MHPGWLRCSSVTYRRVCAFVAPCHPGASTTKFDRLSHSRALSSRSFALIGAGGLGGPVAYALAAAGARRLILCDPDVVDLSNLQRQVQFTTADVGRPKTEALADELSRRGVAAERVTALPVRFDRDSAARVLDGADVVVECSDDPVTKFAVNDAAVARGLPFAIGAVERYGGQVLAAWPGRTACYRCLFEDPPSAGEAPSCAGAGVLGAAVAVVGGHLARAALALAREPRRGADDERDAVSDPASAGELLVWDDLTSRSGPRRVRYNPRPDCLACHGEHTLHS